ncbi:hypothetical protein C1645_874901 [Glomus cerebriforme]|uniref:F-box domain-containing protein n=1 Tax=Glomus cerebriforme TaxID=658196 RepID=A0A397T4L5_9GLOM|nr:hypothetical protein C1645_874901 [Glomus cerebriforme]
MSKLNSDILYLIFKELQNDKNTLYSCLSVNKTWCEIIIPILWKNPWKYLKEGNEILLLDVIISHLSDESKNNLGQHFNFLINSYQKPLFNYIRFCKHLNIKAINWIIVNKLVIYLEYNHIKMLRNEIFNLFINENTIFTHLYIPYQFDYQIHLIPGAERCFSEIKFLSCNTNINDNVLSGITNMCKSIKKLEFFIEGDNNNYGIVKLIESQKRLSNIRFLPKSRYINKAYCKILENSLIKHSNTIEYFKMTRQPTTKFLLSFKNLKRLELNNDFCSILTWNCLENLSLPLLRILRVRGIPINFLLSLIENTNGSLIEIKIDNLSYDNINNNRIIQAIYQNCSNLKYLKLSLRNNDIKEFENLLINCQYLDELFIPVNSMDDTFYWDNLFNILTKSSPTSLFKFKFSFKYNRAIKLESLKLFFDNWKGRHPILLQIISSMIIENYYDLIEQYMAEGTVKNYDCIYDSIQCNHTFKDFEWI